MLTSEVATTTLLMQEEHMQIVAVDESSKKALTRSRRVLGAFLFRIGSRSFAGRLSQQGIDALVANLRKEASKNTAVALYLSGRLGSLKPIAKIGAGHLWDADGNYAFKTTGNMNQHGRTETSGTWLALRSICRMAALFHDVGKANQQFQDKLRGKGNGGERIRHELLSCMMFEQWCDNVPSSGSGGWLERLIKDPESLSLMRGVDGCAAVSQKWADIFQSAKPQEDIEETAGGYAQDLLAKIHEANTPSDLARYSISWLILTHHKAISAVNADRSGSNIDMALPGLPQLNAFLDPRPSNIKLVADGLPWDNSSWLESVRDNSKSLFEKLKSPEVAEAFSGGIPLTKQKIESIAECGNSVDLLSNIDQRSYFVLNLAAMARPLLILSDYIASAQKEACADAQALSAPSFAFANTDRGPNASGGLADTLATHLIKARRMIDPFFSLADRKSHFAPRLDSSKYRNVSPTSTVSPSSIPERFKWQDLAVQEISNFPNVSTRPAFAVIISETGAGKTIGGTKIMSALSGGSMRYTCALGLRSLTLQTGSSYRDNFGFGPTECCTLVGDSLYVKIQEGAARLADSRDEPAFAADSSMSIHESSGSESLDDYPDLFFDVDASEADFLRKALQVEKTIAAKVFTRKTRQLIETPVVVCTIDHLMQASILQRGSDAQPLLRLMTSDLILDEIDNYSIEDLKALCRLAHVAGLYRRRVVLMSATVSSTAVEALYRAWHAGLLAADYRLGRNESEAPALFMTHNTVHPVMIDACDSSNAVAAIDAYFLKVAVHSSSQIANKMSALDVEGMSLVEKFKAIFKQAMLMSEHHNVLLSQASSSHCDFPRLSIGVVRFNKVQQARQFARWLHSLTESELPLGVDLKIQCYHSRFPMLFLSNIETELNGLLKRDRDPVAESARLQAHPIISSWIQAKAGARQYIAIVCSTSIQETGRDHDYDWAVVEPRSTRSVVQMSGRVLRHREKKAQSLPNIAMLSQEFAPINLAKPSSVGMELANIAAPRLTTNEEQWNCSKLFAAFVNGQKSLPSSKLSTKPTATLDEFAKRITRRPAASSSEEQSRHKSLVRDFSAPPDPLPPFTNRTKWFSSDFFSASSGVFASPCLHASVGQQDLLGKIEHLAMRFHLELDYPYQIKKSNAFSATLLFSTPANPYRFPLEWLWGRHAVTVKFRRQERRSRTFSFSPHAINTDEKLYGLWEIFDDKGVSTSLPQESRVEDGVADGEFTCVNFPERTLISSHFKNLVDPALSLDKKAELHVRDTTARFKEFGVHFSTQKFNSHSSGVSFSMGVYEGQHVYFDVILGGDSASSSFCE